MGAVDLELDVQPILAQQHGAGRWHAGQEPHKLRAVAQRRLSARREAELKGGGAAVAHGDGEGSHIGPRGFTLEREALVEQAVRHSERRRAPLGLVCAGAVPRQHVGAVDGVEEGAPARVCGVDDEAGVVHRAHQLRPRNQRQLGVHVLRAHLKGRRSGREVARVLEQCGVGGRVGRPGVGAMPRVELSLQLVAPVEQRPVARRHVLEDRAQAVPKLARRDAGAWKKLVVDKGLELVIDAQPARRRRRDVRQAPCDRRGGSVATTNGELHHGGCSFLARVAL
mmetsp:Transcript_5511/g.17658  ORF Transcript_5511/g.17658 Transcript_5511/m.17658 type:complete len:282 (-) Transcript_5511:17-862(-)